LKIVKVDLEILRVIADLKVCAGADGREAG
jgi:hypothetical protein